MKKSKLSIKYRPIDLLPVSSFISFCESYGVDTNEDELEYFEKEELLLPAARVARGYNEYRRILPDKGEWIFVYKDELKKHSYKQLDPKIYYCSSGFSIQGNDWLDYYISNNMVQDPAESVFRPWNMYGKYQTFTENLELFEDDYEHFYSRQQMYPLAFLTKNMKVSIKDDSLFATDNQWIKNGRHIAEFMGNLVDKFIRPKTYEYVQTINLLSDVRQMFSPINKRAFKFYDTQLKELGDSKEATADANDLRKRLLEEIRPTAKLILNSNKISIDELSDKRLLILEAGTFSANSKTFNLRKHYLDKLSEDDLVEAEMPYKDASLINRFLELLGEPYLESKQLLLSIKLSRCTICDGQYMRKRKNQVTCASPTCKRVHNSNFKREKRQTDPKYGI